MELINGTGMLAGYTMGMDPDAREYAVVVVKGTFTIPKDGEPCELAPEQVPIVEADTFTGEPGFSATIYESDYALRKPRCDVLLNGSAYAPGGRPATRVRVAMHVGSMSKAFDVIGDSTWKRGFFSMSPRRPEPFTVMPITYDRAYGGVDDSNPKKVAAFLPNPVGVGYHKKRKQAAIVGLPVPNTMEVGRPVTSVTGKYRPMSFGPIGRSWPSRIRHAGTYDDEWTDNVFPFLPKDFDERYYQCAPPEQQIDYPKGGEDVELLNLTPEGRTRFRLPELEVPVEFTDEFWKRAEIRACLDTILIDADKRRTALVWRASTPVRRGLGSIRQVVIGRMPNGWYRARALGKTYYKSLQQLSASRRSTSPPVAV